MEVYKESRIHGQVMVYKARILWWWTYTINIQFSNTTESEFLHLQSQIGASPYVEFGVRKRGIHQVNMCFLCPIGGVGGSFDSSPHEGEIIVESTFYIVWSTWMVPSFMKVVLLGWHNSIIKRRKKARIVAHLCLFWSTWKQGNTIVFWRRGHIDSDMECVFSNIWSKVRG